MKVNDKTAIWYSFGAYLIWGLFPLYWKLVKTVPAEEILSHRIVWSFVFMAVLLTRSRNWAGLRSVLAEPAKIRLLMVAAFTVTANWLTYIWAVNSGHIVEASLGYYINPLFSVFLGVVVLHEKLDRWQIAALSLALTGVLVLTVQYGQVPWISLLLAITFGSYGLTKKKIKIDPYLSLAAETLIATPVAMIYLTLRQVNGEAAFGQSAPITIILIGAGIVTAVPLLWFAKAALHLPLSTLGFIQYLTPTIQLLIGILIFREPFTHVDLMAFGLIWIALAVYSVTRPNIWQVLKIGQETPAGRG